jgi:hypothetical protein
MTHDEMTGDEITRSRIKDDQKLVLHKKTRVIDVNSLPKSSWIFPRVAGIFIRIVLGHATVFVESDQIFNIMIDSLPVPRTPQKLLHA